MRLIDLSSEGRASHFGRASLLAVLLLSHVAAQEPARSDHARSIDRDLSDARSEFQATVETLRGELSAQLRVKREYARKHGDLELFEKVDAELAALRSNGRYPSSIRSTKSKITIQKAKRALLKALNEAKVQYTQANLLEDAYAVDKDWERLNANTFLDGIEMKDSPSTNEAAWEELLTGPSLNGWIPTGERNATWQAKDGVLIGHSEGSATALVTEKHDYGDVEIRIETMLSEGANSGVIVGRQGDGDGYVIKIGGTGSEDAYGQTGNISRQAANGRTLVLQDPPLVKIAQDTWFTMDVLYTRGEICVSLDGVVISRHIEREIGEPGHIGLMCRGASTAAFKSVKVRPAAVPAAENQNKISE